MQSPKPNAAAREARSAAQPHGDIIPGVPPPPPHPDIREPRPGQIAASTRRLALLAKDHQGARKNALADRIFYAR